MEFPVIIEYGRFEVTLTSQGIVHELVSLEKEVLIGLIEVVWVTEPRVAVVYMHGEPPIRLAFDRISYRHVSFEPFRDAVRNSIRKTYRVPDTMDPFDWVANGDSFAEFRRRFPAADIGVF